MWGFYVAVRIPASALRRGSLQRGSVDIGAYEFAGAGAPLVCR